MGRRGAWVLIAVLALVAALGIGILGAGWLLSAAETNRTTPRFDPPVMAGQNVIGGCSGGFYARRGDTIVLTISAHCSTPGETIRDGSGRVIGVLGPRAQLTACPSRRFCAPSDFMPLELTPDRIPWGHLDLIDLGAGGYRRLDPSIRALACGDIEKGDRVEMNGREHYRTGTVLQVGRYEHATDTIFPCMVVADIKVVTGDSGGAVLIDGRPAGIVARQLDGLLGFTPLAEGLENLGLVLCADPNCGLAPNP